MRQGSRPIATASHSVMTTVAPWSVEERALLIRAVNVHGLGQWGRILQDRQFQFASSRTELCLCEQLTRMLTEGSVRFLKGRYFWDGSQARTFKGKSVEHADDCDAPLKADRNAAPLTKAPPVLSRVTVQHSGPLSSSFSSFLDHLNSNAEAQSLVVGSGNDHLVMKHSDESNTDIPATDATSSSDSSDAELPIAEDSATDAPSDPRRRPVRATSSAKMARLDDAFSANASANTGRETRSRSSHKDSETRRESHKDSETRRESQKEVLDRATTRKDNPEESSTSSDEEEESFEQWEANRRQPFPALEDAASKEPANAVRPARNVTRNGKPESNASLKECLRVIKVSAVRDGYKKRLLAMKPGDVIGSSEGGGGMGCGAARERLVNAGYFDIIMGHALKGKSAMKRTSKPFKFEYTAREQKSQ